ncbi:MAG: GNAT family N-acetyltransferase [Acidimicrobiia bacterium]|nr:GNAT family N-acetyltransferase [Acidimicrobiia bacterium]
MGQYDSGEHIYEIATALEIEASLKIETEPSASDVEFLYARITEANLAVTGLPAAERISAWVRNDSGEIEAGIYGWNWGGTAEVDLLWVSESRRSAGIGSALLTAFESEAIARGCSQIVLSTFDFQAPEFYERRGYASLGRVDNYPAGGWHTTMRKLI